MGNLSCHQFHCCVKGPYVKISNTIKCGQVQVCIYAVGQLSQKVTLPGKDFPLQLCDSKCVTHLTQINAVITHKQVQTLLRRRCVHACKNNTSQLHKNGMLLFIRLDLFFDILFVLEPVNVAYLLNSCQISHLFCFLPALKIFL